eukprot:TRINITY_DN4968_c0_g1_i1.p1 TRINITY_DN4968_c0_g1~~TRINITY_DN4968_c0_g1_i1.p1  ORF type:complete len:347 (+),score=25.37 TRINITY_DN4968_c0_g1_i1:222-1262(+)
MLATRPCRLSATLASTFFAPLGYRRLSFPPNDTSPRSVLVRAPSVASFRAMGLGTAIRDWSSAGLQLRWVIRGGNEPSCLANRIRLKGARREQSLQLTSAERCNFQRAVAGLSMPLRVGETGPFDIFSRPEIRRIDSSLRSDRMSSWAQYSGLSFLEPADRFGNDNNDDRQQSDYKLSLGKIVDTLRNDYPSIFERKPDFSIYDENVVLELGRPFHAVPALRGKRAYCRALTTLQNLAVSTVRDGTVSFHIGDGTAYGHTLRVNWTCRGQVRGLCQPVYISAVSLYSVASQAVPVTNGSSMLSHLINRHALEFVEIHPPRLRSMLLGVWWNRQMRPLEPTLACENE